MVCDAERVSSNAWYCASVTRHTVGRCGWTPPERGPIPSKYVWPSPPSTRTPFTFIAGSVEPPYQTLHHTCTVRVDLAMRPWLAEHSDYLAPAQGYWPAGATDPGPRKGSPGHGRIVPAPAGRSSEKPSRRVARRHS